ncbi:MAG: hypothetical protein EBV06_14095 [Planctomycetia bacterium]|nr:hypothetical protein [Planctomycetia bacterium]
MRSSLSLVICVMFVSAASPWGAPIRAGSDGDGKLCGTVANSPGSDWSFEPAFTLRIKSLDGLIADMRHLYQKAGREEEGKAFEKAMQARTGPKGLEGVDTTMPLGFSAAVDPKLDRSPMFLMLPVADETTFLKFVASLGNEPRKQDDGSYRVTVEGVPLISMAMFRFAHGYAYVTLRVTDATILPTADKLPKPEIGLGKGTATASMTIHVSRVPMSVRKLAVSFLGLQWGAMKDEEKDPVGAAAIDDATALLRSLLEEGERMTIQLDLDPKKEIFTLDTSVTPRKGTAMAKDVNALGAMRSAVAGLLVKDALLSGVSHVLLPEQMKKAANAVLDDTFKKGIDQLQEHEREVIEPLIKAALPTLRAGGFDGAVQMSGPSKNGKYRFVVGLGLKDGSKLEQAVKAALKNIPEKSRRGILVDAEKAGVVPIHRVDQSKADVKTRELLGDGPAYFAFRDDALFLAAGESALEALRETLAVKTVTATPLRLQVGINALAVLLSLVDPTMKDAPQAAKEAFKGKVSDRVTLEITGGDQVAMRLTMPTAVLTFAGALDRLRK